MGEIANDRIARFLELIDDVPSEMYPTGRSAVTLDVMFQRMTTPMGDGSPEGLPAICKSWDVPYGKVMTWLMASEARYEVYRRALEVAAHALVAATVELADDAGPDDVAHAKLRIDTRFRVAKYHAPEVYADRTKAETAPPVLGLGDSTAKAAAELLRRVASAIENPSVSAPAEIDVTPTAVERDAA